MNIYPVNLPTQLDFHSVLNTIGNYCISANAKLAVEKLLPTANFKKVDTLLDETIEALSSMTSGYGVPHTTFPEIDKELHTLSIENSVLTATQFNLIKQLYSKASDLILYLHDTREAFPTLFKKVEDEEKHPFILDAIQDIIDEHSIVRNDASPTLSRIRDELATNRKTADRLYRSHINKYKQLGFLADFEESYIQGRRVLSIFVEHKREVKGTILDYSASGKIAFIEPQNVIELNNDKLHLEDEEKKEIYRILKTLTDSLRPYQGYLKSLYQMLVTFDLICAKAKYAKEIAATKPKLSHPSDTIHIINGYHPVLFLHNKAQKINTVPINCHFNKSQRIIVISGPNAGGKSITLKTIGLLQIMLQSGILIPVDPRSEWCIRQQLLGDIGDNQSIEDGLSTYSSRLIKMKYFLEHIKHHSLFLIDEFGTGSDPDMGGALAEVILNQLNKTKSLGVVTTHFTNLKILANQESGIFNASMLFNNKTLRPLYQLQVGEPGSSFTFEVAEKIGLSKDVIQNAKGKLSQERVKMDKLLIDLQQEKNVQIKLKRDLQKQMSKTTSEKREFQELNEKLEESIAKTTETLEEKLRLIELGRRLHALTLEWESSKNKKEIIQKFVKLAGYETFKKKEQELYEKTQEFKTKRIAQTLKKLEIGSKVRMLKSREIGTVKQFNHERAMVTFGRVEINVGIEKLELVF